MPSSKLRKSATGVNYNVVEETPSEAFVDQFDYVMVFPLREVNKAAKSCCPCGGEADKEVPEFVDREQTPVTKRCISDLLERGLELYIYKSCQEDELYVLISVPDEIMVNFAENIDYELLLDKDVMKAKLAAGNPEKRIAPIEFPPYDASVTTIDPFSFIYGRFKKSIDQSLYARGQNGSIFDAATRLKLSHYVITGPVRNGGCDISTSKFLHAGSMLAYFPVHDKRLLRSLTKKCVALTSMPWNQPLDEIRLYFGEKYALYNAFLGHYTLYLIAPAFIGFIFQIVVWQRNNFSHPVLPFFAVVICIWSVTMLEFWKGKESKLSMEWGTIGFEDEEPDRPDFVGRNVRSQIDGKMIAYFPFKQARTRLFMSFFVIFMFILLVVTTVAGIYWLRFSLQSEIGTYASTVASVLNTVQITIFNMCYQYLVTKFTELENHRTDTLYQDSLISKLFIFQFVNSYASFFYLAFIASWLPSNPDQVNPNFKGQCGWYDCMQPLSINLAIIFGSRLVVTNAVALIVPYITFKANENAQSVQSNDKTKHYDLTIPEREFLHIPFDPIFDSIKNYADTVIQYGFMSLFITALPIACFFDMLSSYATLHVQAYNMGNNFQRPIPMMAEDIGTWQSIFTIMSVLAVISNAGLICFTMDHSTWNTYVLYNYPRMWIFIGFQWVLIGLQFLLVQIIPDRPEKVSIQIKRQSFIVSKLIDFQEDLDYDNDPTGKGVESPDFVDLGCFGCTKKVRLQKDPSAGNSAANSKEQFPFCKSSEFPSKDVNSFPELLTKTNLEVLRKAMPTDKPIDSSPAFFELSV